MSRGLMLALILGGVVVSFTLIILHVNRIERCAVDAALRLLPNHTREPLGHRFVGQAHGIELMLRLADRGDTGNQNDGPWTEVHLPSPPGVSLELRPQDPVEKHMVTRGLARDVEVGDAAFDAEFIVEMAPASLAPALFDADLRRHLLDLRPLRVVPNKGGGLRLDKERWDGDRFAALIEAGALLAARLHQVAGAGVAQAEWAGSPGPNQHSAELAELDAIRAARREKMRRNVVIVVVGLLVILVVSLLRS